MNQDQFVVKHQARWQELTQVLGQVEKKGLKKLEAAEVERLGQLYRRTASDLAYARTYYPGSDLNRYLNDLVTRAHSVIYQEETRWYHRLWRTLAVTVPQTVRAVGPMIWLSVLLMSVGGLVGFFAITHYPNLAEALVPKMMREFVVGDGEGADWAVAERPVIGTAIMLNNMRVGLLAFVAGVTLGIGTTVLLFYNGLIVGALYAHFFAAGMSYPFWSLIVPHGALELMAIFMCGAAGFAMGWPIVSPGEYPRLAAFSRGAHRAAILFVGSLPFFAIAAVIEGWVTPMVTLSAEGKYLVGAATGCIGLAYWLLPGRRTKASLVP